MRNQDQNLEEKGQGQEIEKGHTENTGQGMITAHLRRENVVGHVQGIGDEENLPVTVTGKKTKNHEIERKVVMKRGVKVGKEKTVRVK